MAQNPLLHVLQRLIDRTVADTLYEPDGYIDDPSTLHRLSSREAQTALDFGITIGVASRFPQHHGPRKGEYVYSIVTSVVWLRRLVCENGNEDSASIAPHQRHPAKLLHYIHEIHEIEDQVMAMERFPHKEEVARLRAEFPPGCRVELEKMPDSQTGLLPGDQGTVDSVDDIGTIHVNWDNGSRLGVSYRWDKVKHI